MMFESPAKSDMSSPGDDMKKIQQLYVEAKESNREQKSPSTDQENYEYESKLNQKESECQNLRSSLVRTQEELDHAKEQNDALLSKYKKAQEEVMAFQDRMAKQSTLTQHQQAELEGMRRQLGEKSGLVDYSQFRVANYQRDIFLKENEVSGLKKTLQEKNGALATLTVVQDHFKGKSADTLKVVESKDKVITELKDKIKELQDELDELYIKRKVEGTALLEIEHLKADNERLIGMLKSKDQYKEFAEFFEDSGGALRVPPKQEPKGRYKRTKVAEKSEIEQNWVPQDAYKLAHDLLHKHKGVFNTTTINGLLADLNKIWRERERKQITRIKQKYCTEIANLRRQGAMSSCYDAVDSKKQISRLKTDLKCAYNEVKKNICASEKARNVPKQAGVVEETLRMANTLQRERKHLIDENERMKKQLDKLQTVVSAEGVERARYMEGAAWMASTLANEADNYVELVEGLCNEYRAKKREKEARGEADPIFLAEIHAELINKLEEAAGDFRVKVHGMKGSVECQAGTIGSSVKKGTGKARKDYSKEFEDVMRSGGIEI